MQTLAGLDPVRKPLFAYLGQTRSKSLISTLSSLGVGEMTNRGETPPRRFPFALDNGAYTDYQHQRPFDAVAFLRDVEKASPLRPDFIVLPDLVAKGKDSLSFSLSFREQLQGAAPLYLALQDGMSEEDILPVLSLVQGLFLGGSLPWKLSTGRAWGAFAKAHNIPFHIGRVGSMKRVRWARECGATTIDSCLPLWSQRKLNLFLWALLGAQGELRV